MNLIAPFGILESARTGLLSKPLTPRVSPSLLGDMTLLTSTGLMALPRSPLYGPNEEVEKDAQDLVDASTLPPG
jgi:acetolactate synthase I/III small subunit